MLPNGIDLYAVEKLAPPKYHLEYFSGRLGMILKKENLRVRIPSFKRGTSMLTSIKTWFYKFSQLKESIPIKSRNHYLFEQAETTLLGKI